MNIKKFLEGILILVTAAFSISSLSLVIYVSNMAKNLPEISPQSFNIQLTSMFYDNKGELVANRYYTENRVWTEFANMPQNYVNAVVSIEDKGFWSHQGIEPSAIFRAFFSSYGGASTITQQLSRNILIDEEERYQRTLSRKLKEALIAIRIEEVMTKEDIFTYYANVINFGQNAYGVESAAFTYFGKSLDQLTLEECALLAGIPQLPDDNNPIEYPNKALARRNDILDAMYANGYISQKELEKTKAIPINLNPQIKTSDPTYGSFIDTTIKEAEDLLKELNLPSLFVGGYQIYTTMDRAGQILIEEISKDEGLYPIDAGGEQCQVAMVVYDQNTGEVKAMLGGRNYVAMGLNRVFVKGRQPGSTFKPIAAYGPAIEMGLTASDVYIDGPVNISGYQPKNAGLTYSGSVTVRTAIMKSINTVAVQVLNNIGPETGWKFAKRLGVDMTDNEKYYLSIALGGLEKGATPMEMARAFGAFGNEGVLEKPHLITKIIDKNGQLVYEFQPESSQAMSPTVAWYMTDLLKSVVQGGTGTQAYISGLSMAGKTGTSEMPGVDNANKDLWFVGYTPDITASVWMGFDNPSAKNGFYNQYGGGFPARFWKTFMQAYLAGKEKNSFVKPNPLEVIKRTIVQKNIVAPPKEETKEETTDTNTNTNSNNNNGNGNGN